MAILRTLAFGAVVAGAGLAYYVQRRSQQTGEGYLTVLAQLPATVRRSWSETKDRAQLAIAAGTEAARTREAKLEREIAAADAARPAR